MYALHNDTRLVYIPDTFEYSHGMVGFKFDYTADLVGTPLKFYFMPRLLGIN
jgi:hypothetical protein